MRTVKLKPVEIEHLVPEGDTTKCSICNEIYKPRRRIRFHAYKWKVRHIRCKFPKWSPFGERP